MLHCTVALQSYSSVTVQYYTSVFQYSDTLECYSTVLQYIVTVQCCSTVSRYSVTVHCCCTVLQYSVAVVSRYSVTVHCCCTVLQYRHVEYLKPDIQNTLIINYEYYLNFVIIIKLSLTYKQYFNLHATLLYSVQIYTKYVIIVTESCSALESSSPNFGQNITFLMMLP